MLSLAGLGAAALIADTLVVEAGVTQPFDRTGLLTVHRDAASDLRGLMDSLSFLGNTVEAIGIGLLIALVLIWKGRYALSVVPIFAPAGASLFGDLMKHIFQRPRPHFWPKAEVLHTYSFPSGHATVSAALAIAVIWLSLTLESLALRLTIAIVSVAFSLGVGLSRVYLGVHWPTDVLGGYALAMVCVPLTALLSMRIADDKVVAAKVGAWRLPGRYRSER